MAIKPEQLPYLDTNTLGQSVVDHRPDLTGPHPDSENLYRSAILHSPEEMVSHNTLGGASKKSVFTVPQNSLHGPGERFMVKPYHENMLGRSLPHAGWAELSNQALYHAGGIGDLHQKVHVSEHHGHPAVVIHLEPGLKRIDRSNMDRFRPDYTPHPAFHDAHKIAMMDFLTDNRDRHDDNVLQKPNGNLLALDHGLSFQYETTPRGDWRRGLDALPSSKRPEDWADDFNWWKGASPKIKAAMQTRLGQIKDKRYREHIERNFNERAKHLDFLANQGVDNLPERWYDMPVKTHKMGHLSEDELAKIHYDQAEINHLYNELRSNAR